MAAWHTLSTWSVVRPGFRLSCGPASTAVADRRLTSETWEAAPRFDARVARRLAFWDAMGGGESGESMAACAAPAPSSLSGFPSFSVRVVASSGPRPSAVPSPQCSA